MSNIELGKWYRHRGSKTVPQRILAACRTWQNGNSQCRLVFRYRDGTAAARPLKFRYISIDKFYHHWGDEGDIMAYKFVTSQ